MTSDRVTGWGENPTWRRGWRVVRVSSRTGKLAVRLGNLQGEGAGDHTHFLFVFKLVVVVMPCRTGSFSATLPRKGSVFVFVFSSHVVASTCTTGRRGLVRCAAKKNQRKERKYGEGREQIGSSVTESLHFGRLIGETAKDTAERLEGSATGDARAKLYLEKWEQEEDASYSMFESLLNGKPLDARSKKMKEIEFESILELSTDDEVFREYELVLSSGDDADDADGVDALGATGQTAGAVASKVCYIRFL